MKLNPITKNPEIMRGVFEIEDGKFMHDNPYGYNKSQGSGNTRGIHSVSEGAE